MTPFADPIPVYFRFGESAAEFFIGMVWGRWSLFRQLQPSAPFLDLAMISVTKQLRQWLVDTRNCPETWTDDDLYRREAGKALADGSLSAEKYTELTGDSQVPTTKPNPEKVFGTNNNGPHVKDPSEQYCETRYSLKSKHTGQPVVDAVTGREAMSLSEGAKARHGVLLKHLANRSGIVHNPLSEHEQSLLNEVAEQQEWAGKIGNEWYDKVTGHRNVKALIDDTTSGGLEITPIEFDSDIITFPLLHGELFPQVNVRPVPRGRRIEGASITNPTMSWGGYDDSDIQSFDTSSMVSAIDTTVFAVDTAVFIGRDFLADTPVEVGNVLTGLIGNRLMEELDGVIADGNGTTQPEGLFQASGVSTINTDNGSSGPPTLSDYITLLFSLAKQYRRQNLNVAFVSNDTSYQRSREIKIGTGSPSTDQRAALAPMMNTEFFNEYSTLGWPHKVENNNVANSQCGIAALNKYRMYRRQGIELRFVEGGRELATKNLMLLVARARYGGRLMDSNAMAKWTDGQS